MRWKRALYTPLNRPGLRFLLAVAGTVHASLRARRLCTVRYENCWIHRFPNAVLVEPEMLVPVYSELESMCSDIWNYQYQPQKGGVVLDIGAGTGWSTLFFSRSVGASGRVVSIEAHPVVFSCLRRMCFLNRLDNVTLSSMAVAATKSEVLISDGWSHQANSTVGTTKGICIQADTLDSIVSRLNLKRIDFLKMNIEGAECHAIDGMSETVAKTLHVCISCHDFLADEGGDKQLRTKAKVIAFLTRQGFEIKVRSADPRPYIRDTVYGLNRALSIAI